MKKEEFSFTAYAFQVIEFPTGVLLKRGNSRLVIGGTQALNSIITILTLSSGRICHTSELYSAFDIDQHETITQLIGQLIDNKFLVKGDSEDKLNESREDVFYWQHSTSKEEVNSKLNKFSYNIIGLNELTSAMFQAIQTSLQISETNIQIVDYHPLRSSQDLSSNFENSIISYEQWKQQKENSNLDINIAISTFGGQELLLELNDFCAKQKKIFLPVLIENEMAQIGPLLVDNKFACLNCLRQRQNANFPNAELERVHESSSQDAQEIYALHPSFLRITAEMACIELLNTLGGIDTKNLNTLLEINLNNINTSRHPAIKFPNCSHCNNK